MTTKWYPTSRWQYCEKCDKSGNHASYPSCIKYHDPVKHADVLNTSPLDLMPAGDGKLLLYCWWCHCSGPSEEITPITVYHHRDILAAAGITEKFTDRIHIWQFDESPILLRLMSNHGGDEDWLALLPPCWIERGIPSWLETGGAFGCCDVSTERLVNDWTIAIGAHA